jgi:RNase P/RNase MRP subunit p29
VNTLEDALTPLLGTQVYVFVALAGTQTGRSGKVVSVGTDHMVLNDGSKKWIIPYTAINMVQPKE